MTTLFGPEKYGNFAQKFLVSPQKRRAVPLLWNFFFKTIKCDFTEQKLPFASGRRQFLSQRNKNIMCLRDVYKSVHFHLATSVFNPMLGVYHMIGRH